MAKKQDAFYFESFVASVAYACEAAQMLEKTLSSFDPQNLKEKLKELHAVEHAADLKKHDVMNALAKAFITPIEREDIILLCQNIDEMVDQIEDVLMRIYCNNITSMRPDALKMVDVLVRTCRKTKELMAEFENFKRSKTLKPMVIEINTLEEEADELYINALRDLHTTCTDPLEVIAWHEVYTYLEKCVDSCEHVSDVVETVIMKNT